MNFAAYDCRQKEGKSNKPKRTSGKNGVQNNPGVQTSSNNSQPSRKPPGMEGKCMRCGKPEHQPGQKCAAKNAKCKECHKIGHFYKVCQSKKRARRANLAQVAPQTEQDTHIDENGVRQPNPPMVNMLKIVNHIGATSGSQEKHLKFPIDVDPRGPYKHHLVVRVDTGAAVNCMNEKTFKKLFLKVKPDSLQNESRMSHTSTHNITGTTAQPTTSFRTLRPSTATNERTTTGTLIQNTVQLPTSFRTTTPTKATTGRTNTFRTTTNTMTRQQVNPIQVPQDTSCNTHLESCMHVHQPISQVCKPGESLALRKVKHPLNGKTSVSRLPLTKQDILSQYSGCFEGIRRFPGDLYKFHLKPDYKPAQHAPRKVPVHLETACKEEIESLVKQGILEEVNEHTDWVNSYVIVEKDTGNHHSPNHTVKKKLRICLDPRDLNEALERELYHTRSVDEITAKLQGMTVFTIVDFKKGYWMVVLHPDSRKVTCMALPFGRFQWTCLPMGTVVAQDIFQSKLDAIFIGMEGVTGIADDMIIAGKDEMEHDRNFLAFMEKCMENNLTVNSEKIQL